MKILLCCAGGYSTSILMNKIRKYAQTSGKDIRIEATGANENVKKIARDFDVILVAPQIKYRRDEIARETGKPVVGIAPLDYGSGKPEKIVELAENALKQEEK